MKVTANVVVVATPEVVASPPPAPAPLAPKLETAIPDAPLGTTSAAMKPSLILPPPKSLAGLDVAADAKVGWQALKDDPGELPKYTKAYKSAEEQATFFDTMLANAGPDELAVAEKQAEKISDPVLKKALLTAVALRRAQLPGGPLYGTASPESVAKYRDSLSPVAPPFVADPKLATLGTPVATASTGESHDGVVAMAKDTKHPLSATAALLEKNPPPDHGEALFRSVDVKIPANHEKRHILERLGIPKEDIERFLLTGEISPKMAEAIAAARHPPAEKGGPKQQAYGDSVCLAQFVFQAQTKRLQAEKDKIDAGLRTDKAELAKHPGDPALKAKIAEGEKKKAAVNKQMHDAYNIGYLGILNAAEKNHVDQQKVVASEAKADKAAADKIDPEKETDPKKKAELVAKKEKLLALSETKAGALVIDYEAEANAYAKAKNDKKADKAKIKAADAGIIQGDAQVAKATLAGKPLKPGAVPAYVKAEADLAGVSDKTKPPYGATIGKLARAENDAAMVWAKSDPGIAPFVELGEADKQKLKETKDAARTKAYADAKLDLAKKVPAGLSGAAADKWIEDTANAIGADAASKAEGAWIDAHRKQLSGDIDKLPPEKKKELKDTTAYLKATEEIAFLGYESDCKVYDGVDLKALSPEEREEAAAAYAGMNDEFLRLNGPNYKLWAKYAEPKPPEDLTGLGPTTAEAADGLADAESGKKEAADPSWYEKIPGVNKSAYKEKGVEIAKWRKINAEANVELATLCSGPQPGMSEAARKRRIYDLKATIASNEKTVADLHVDQLALTPDDPKDPILTSKKAAAKAHAASAKKGLDSANKEYKALVGQQIEDAKLEPAKAFYGDVKAAADAKVKATFPGAPPKIVTAANAEAVADMSLKFVKKADALPPEQKFLGPEQKAGLLKSTSEVYKTSVGLRLEEEADKKAEADRLLKKKDELDGKSKSHGKTAVVMDKQGKALFGIPASMGSSTLGLKQKYYVEQSALEEKHAAAAGVKAGTLTTEVAGSILVRAKTTGKMADVVAMYDALEPHIPADKKDEFLTTSVGMHGDTAVAAAGAGAIPFAKAELETGKKQKDKIKDPEKKAIASWSLYTSALATEDAGVNAVATGTPKTTIGKDEKGEIVVTSSGESPGDDLEGLGPVVLGFESDANADTTKVEKPSPKLGAAKADALEYKYQLAYQAYAFDVMLADQEKAIDDGADEAIANLETGYHDTNAQAGGMVGTILDGAKLMKYAALGTPAGWLAAGFLWSDKGKSLVNNKLTLSGNLAALHKKKLDEQKGYIETQRLELKGKIGALRAEYAKLGGDPLKARVFMARTLCVLTAPNASVAASAAKGLPAGLGATVTTLAPQLPATKSMTGASSASSMISAGTGARGVPKGMAYSSAAFEPDQEWLTDHALVIQLTQSVAEIAVTCFVPIPVGGGALSAASWAKTTISLASKINVIKNSAVAMRTIAVLARLGFGTGHMLLMTQVLQPLASEVLGRTFGFDSEELKFGSALLQMMQVGTMNAVGGVGPLEQKLAATASKWAKTGIITGHVVEALAMPLGDALFRQLVIAQIPDPEVRKHYEHMMNWAMALIPALHGEHKEQAQIAKEAKAHALEAFPNNPAARAEYEKLLIVSTSSYGKDASPAEQAKKIELVEKGLVALNATLPPEQRIDVKTHMKLYVGTLDVAAGLKKDLAPLDKADPTKAIDDPKVNTAIDLAVKAHGDEPASPLLFHVYEKMGEGMGLGPDGAKRFATEAMRRTIGRQILEHATGKPASSEEVSKFLKDVGGVDPTLPPAKYAAALEACPAVAALEPKARTALVSHLVSETVRTHFESEVGAPAVKGEEASAFDAGKKKYAALVKSIEESNLPAEVKAKLLADCAGSLAAANLPPGKNPREAFHARLESIEKETGVSLPKAKLEASYQEHLKQTVLAEAVAAELKGTTMSPAAIEKRAHELGIDDPAEVAKPAAAKPVAEVAPAASAKVDATDPGTVKSVVEHIRPPDLGPLGASGFGLDQPPMDAAFIKSHGLEPKQSIEYGGKTIHTSDPFVGPDGRTSMIAYVPNGDGTFSMRTFYKSGSQGVWRVASHRGQMGNPLWIGKGNGEHTTTLPIDLGKALEQRAMAVEPKKLSEKDGERAFYGHLEIVLASGFEKGQGKSKGEPIGTFGAQLPVPKKGKTVGDPTTFEFKDPGYAPNLDAPQDHYKAKLPEYGGEVDAYVYPSKDGSLRYLLYRDPVTKRVWVGQVEKANPKIGEFGAPKEPVDPGALDTPAIEYWDQIPDKYRGAKVNGEYSDASAYQKDLPFMKDFSARMDAAGTKGTSKGAALFEPAGGAPSVEAPTPLVGPATGSVKVSKELQKKAREKLDAMMFGETAPEIRLKVRKSDGGVGFVDKHGYKLLAVDHATGSALVLGPDGKIYHAASDAIVYFNNGLALGATSETTQALFKERYEKAPPDEQAKWQAMMGKAAAKSPEHAALIQRMYAHGEPMPFIESTLEWSLKLDHAQLGKRLAPMFAQQLDVSCGPTSVQFVTALHDFVLARLFAEHPELVAEDQASKLESKGSGGLALPGSTLGAGEYVPAPVNKGFSAHMESHGFKGKQFVSVADTNVELLPHRLAEVVEGGGEVLMVAPTADGKSLEITRVTGVKRKNGVIVELSVVRPDGSKKTLKGSELASKHGKLTLCGKEVLHLGLPPSQAVAGKSAGTNFAQWEGDSGFQSLMRRTTGVRYEARLVAAGGAVDGPGTVNTIVTTVQSGKPVFLRLGWEVNGKSLAMGHVVVITEARPKIGGKPGAIEVFVYDPAMKEGRWMDAATFDPSKPGYPHPDPSVHGRLTDILVPESMPVVARTPTEAGVFKKAEAVMDAGAAQRFNRLYSTATATIARCKERGHLEAASVWAAKAVLFERALTISDPKLRAEIIDRAQSGELLDVAYLDRVTKLSEPEMRASLDAMDGYHDVLKSLPHYLQTRIKPEHLAAAAEPPCGLTREEAKEAFTKIVVMLPDERAAFNETFDKASPKERAEMMRKLGKSPPPGSVKKAPPSKPPPLEKPPPKDPAPFAAGGASEVVTATTSTEKKAATTARDANASDPSHAPWKSGGLPSKYEAKELGPAVVTSFDKTSLYGSYGFQSIDGPHNTPRPDGTQVKDYYRVNTGETVMIVLKPGEHTTLASTDFFSCAGCAVTAVNPKTGEKVVLLTHIREGDGNQFKLLKKQVDDLRAQGFTGFEVVAVVDPVAVKGKPPPADPGMYTDGFVGTFPKGGDLAKALGPDVKSAKVCEATIGTDGYAEHRNVYVTETGVSVEYPGLAGNPGYIAESFGGAASVVAPLKPKLPSYAETEPKKFIGPEIAPLPPEGSSADKAKRVGVSKALYAQKTATGPIEQKHVFALLDQTLLVSRRIIVKEKQATQPKLGEKQALNDPAEVSQCCGIGQSLVFHYLESLGIKEENIKTHQASEVFGTEPIGQRHAFVVAKMPDGKWYLIDPTYKQFFDPKATAETQPGSVGVKMKETVAGREAADDLMEKGYVALTPEVAALYGKALGAPEAMSGKDIMDKLTGESTIAADYDKEELGLPPPPPVAAP